MPAGVDILVIAAPEAPQLKVACMCRDPLEGLGFRVQGLGFRV